MSDLTTILSQLKEIENQITHCMKCGMCQGVCPVFKETGLEGDVTRGKISLIEGLSVKMVSDIGQVKERLDRCLLCGTCAVNCPSGVPILEIFLKARSILTDFKGLSPSKKLIFRGLLKNKLVFNTTLKMGSLFQYILTSKANKNFSTRCCPDVLSGFIPDHIKETVSSRHIVPLAPKAFHTQSKNINRKTGKSGIKIAFFPGCVTDMIYPDIGHSVLKVMEYHGVEVLIPEQQKCCGIPAIASGDKKTFRELVQYNIELFTKFKFDYLITPCATCTSTIKEIWPMMVDNRESEYLLRVKNMSQRTMDISQFLIDILKIKSGIKKHKNNGKITYHDPCHLSKSLGITAQPRDLLRNHTKYEFCEMENANECCGNGGSFNLQNYKISSTIGFKKRVSIKSTGADIVSTSCPACMMQMTDMLSQNNDDIQVRHVIEIYADSIS